MTYEESTQAFAMIEDFLEHYRHQLHKCHTIHERIEKVKELDGDSLVPINMNTTLINLPKEAALTMLEAVLENERKYMAIKDGQLKAMKECLC